MFGTQPNAAQMDEIARLIDAGKVKTFVETILPLSEVRHAHELSQRGRNTVRLRKIFSVWLTKKCGIQPVMHGQ